MWVSERPPTTHTAEGRVEGITVIFALPGGREVISSGWVPTSTAPAPEGVAPSASTAERRRWFARRMSARSPGRSRGNLSEEPVLDGSVPKAGEAHPSQSRATTEDQPLEPQVGLG